MRYYVTIGERTFVVDLDGSRASVDGVEVRADLRDAGGALQHLLLNGRSWPIVATPGSEAGAWTLHVGDNALRADVVDERTRAIREMTGTDTARRGPRPVRAPMPGLVLRVEVEPGQTVQAGQGVVIVEAMKMENELKADGGGVVSRVLVAPGQAVEKGTILIEFAGTGS